MDIPLLPGDSAAIRAAANDLTATVPPLRTARGAALDVESVLTGDLWRGTAYEAFQRVVVRKPLPQALDAAADRMVQAAQELHHFAGRFDENQERLRHLRAQAAATAPAAPGEPDPFAALAAQARAVFEDHRRCLDAVADLFDWLDDQPTFATPPPSSWERVTGTVGDVLTSFGTGVFEGFRDMALGIRDLVVALHPGRWPELWADRGQLWAMLQYAAANPGQFLGELGSALLDLDTLLADPARWLGRRVPDLLLALGTAGTGTVAARTAGAARVARGPLGRLDDAARVMTRTDTTLGRLAHRADGLGTAAQVGRQAPGTLLDRSFAGLVTGGFARQLARVDDLAGKLGTLQATADAASPEPGP